MSIVAGKYFWLNTGKLSHSQKVCRLYKRMLIQLRGKYKMTPVERVVAAAEIRARFDEHADLRDREKAEQLLEAATLEYMRTWKPPVVYGSDKGTEQYENEEFFYVEDGFLDIMYHPLEKAMYPQFFAKREVLKAETMESWKKIHDKMVEEGVPLPK